MRVMAGWISACVWITLLFLSGRCADMKICDEDVFFLGGTYERDIGKTRIEARTDATITSAVFGEGRMVPVYPWVNVSDTEAERKLAQSVNESLIGGGR